MRLTVKSAKKRVQYASNILTHMLIAGYEAADLAQ